MSSSKKLGNYLRTYRIRAGLTQRDVAMLLGLETGSAISRAEKGKGTSSVHVLLGYCILFKAKPKDLVPGILSNTEKTIHTHAHALTRRLKKRQATPIVLERLKFLEKLSQPYGETYAIRRHEQFKKSRTS